MHYDKEELLMDLTLDDKYLLIKDVIVEDAQKEYNHALDFFNSRLLELNTNLYIVEQLIRFPRKLFLGDGPENTIFFGQTINNAIQVSILIITRLVVDQDGDLYTLTSFKKKVYTMIKPEYEKAFRKRLKQMNFDKQEKDLLEKAKRLRNERIAHFSKSFFQGYYDPTMKQEVLTFEELLALRDKLNGILQSFFLNTKPGMLPLSYDTFNSDIREILNRIIYASPILNMPESDSALWRQLQASLTEEDRKQLNYYRVKFGLEEI